MNSGIYCIENFINKKCYVGSSKDFDKRKTEHFRLLRIDKHKNIKLQRSYNKYGENAFRFYILEEVSYEPGLIILKENSWMVKLDSKAEGFNIANASFGDILTHHPDKENIKKRISEGLKKKHASLSDEEKQRRKDIKKGIQNGMYGKHRTEKEKEAISMGQLNYVKKHGHGPTFGISKSEEHKRKMSINAKMRTGNKNAFYGKKHSAKTLKKISDANKGRRSPSIKIIIIDNKEYLGLNNASLATGINYSTLWFRAYSKNPKFKNIYFKEMAV